MSREAAASRKATLQRASIRLRRLRQIAASIRRDGSGAIRQWLGVARARKRQAQGDEDVKCRQPACHAWHFAADLRCVGTCLLPRLSESPADFVKAFMEQLINWDFVAQNMSCQQYGRRVIPGTIPVGRTLTISSGERIPRPPLSIESKGVRRTSRYAITRRPTVSPRRARESDAGSRGCDGRDIFGLSQDAEFPLQCDWQAAADNEHVVRRMRDCSN
jgi:hypothetical protein